MSKCISRHGEYGEHTYPQHAAGADRFVCELCAALDEDDMLAALDRAEVERDAAVAKLDQIRELADEHRLSAFISAPLYRILDDTEAEHWRDS